MIVEDDIEITRTTIDDVGLDDPRRGQLHQCDLFEVSLPLNHHIWADKRGYAHEQIDHHRMAQERLKRMVIEELYGDMIEPFRKLSRQALQSAHRDGSYQEIQRCIRQIDAMINLESINPENERSW